MCSPQPLVREWGRCNGAMARVVVDARERALLQFFSERAEDYFTAQLPCGDVQALADSLW